MSTSVTRPLDLTLDPARAIALVRGLVALPSISGDESAAAEFLTAAMHALGMQAGIDDAGNAVGIAGAAGTADPLDIVLLGHMDTVPGDIPVRIQDGVLHGRGSVDAKGPLAAFVCAAAHSRLPAGVRVIVVAAVEEEIASSKGARHAMSMFTPAACIIGEPSGVCGVTLGYKGRLLVDVSAATGTAHSAGPAPTAAEFVTAWWEAAKRLSCELSAGHDRVFEQLQCRLRSINSGTGSDIEHARAEVSFRLPPRIAPSKLIEQLRGLPESGSVQLAFAGAESAYAGTRSDPVVRALSNAVRASGLTPIPKYKTGTSDMNVVAPHWKCPIAAYGPGDSSLDHTPQEHLVLDEYLASIQVLIRAIESLAAELVQHR